MERSIEVTYGGGEGAVQHGIDVIMLHIHTHTHTVHKHKDTHIHIQYTHKYTDTHTYSTQTHTYITNTKTHTHTHRPLSHSKHTHTHTHTHIHTALSLTLTHSHTHCLSPFSHPRSDGGVEPFCGVMVLAALSVGPSPLLHPFLTLMEASWWGCHAVPRHMYSVTLCSLCFVSLTSAARMSACL